MYTFTKKSQTVTSIALQFITSISQLSSLLECYSIRHVCYIEHRHHGHPRCLHLELATYWHYNCRHIKVI